MNLGATFKNVLVDKDYKTVISNVCDSIINYLSNYCGPNSTYASIPHDATEEFQTDYTKDGISIIKTIKFNEPAAESIRQALTYIGDQINRASNDGTTTGILLYCLIIKYILKEDVDDLRLKDPKYFIKKLKYYLNTYKNSMPIHSIDTIQSIMSFKPKNIREYVAYNLAMVSSKGNVDLSKAIADYAVNAPIEDLFGVFDITHERTESLDGSSYLTIKDQYDLSIHAYCESSTAIDALNDVFKSDNCMIIACEDIINPSLPGFKDLYDELNEYVDGVHELNQDLVILGLQIDPHIAQAVNKFNQNQKYSPNPSPYRIICLRPLEAQNQMIPFYIKAISVLADADNIEPFDMLKTLFTIKNASVDFSDRRLKINGLYKKDGSIFVPKYTLRNDSVYNEFTDMVKLRITNIFNGYSESKVTNDNMVKLLELYRYLICSNRIKISFSGAKHDVLAFRSEMEDALGAVSSGVEKGFVISNFETMLKYFTIESRSTLHEVDRIIVQSFINALKELLKITNKTVENYKEYEQYLNDVLGTLSFQVQSTEDLTPYILKVHSVINDLNQHVINRLDDDTDSENYLMPLFQPASAAKALIGRMSELLPYMLTTSSHIGNWSDRGK